MGASLRHARNVVVYSSVRRSRGVAYRGGEEGQGASESYEIGVGGWKHWTCLLDAWASSVDASQALLMLGQALDAPPRWCLQAQHWSTDVR